MVPGEPPPGAYRYGAAMSSERAPQTTAEVVSRPWPHAVPLDRDVTGLAHVCACVPGHRLAAQVRLSVHRSGKTAERIWSTIRSTSMGASCQPLDAMSAGGILPRSGSVAVAVRDAGQSTPFGGGTSVTSISAGSWGGIGWINSGAPPPVA